jgi:hypothetical protein
MKVNKSEQKVLDKLHIGTEPETVRNPFSGESVTLEPTAVAVYDYLIGSDMRTPFNNNDLNFDIEKIRSYDTPVRVMKETDGNLDARYILNVADSSYFYESRSERDEDFHQLRKML